MPDLVWASCMSLNVASPQVYIRAAPKAELHVHLEGTARAGTVLELARRHRVSLAVRTPSEMQQWFVYRDFSHFCEIYDAISSCLRTIDDYELLLYEFGAEMASQNIRYAEVALSAANHDERGISFDTYLEGLSRGRLRAQHDFGVDIRFIFDIARNPEHNHRQAARRADYTLRVAVEGMKDGVVALGLSGTEVGCPPHLYAPWFEKARESGLHSAPHAGEHAGPKSVWGAVDVLHAQRIAHGVRSVEDTALLEHIASRCIALDVCPTSNLRLGVCSSWNDHPLPLLRESGVAVTIGSDDPALFGTTLTEEITHAAVRLGLDVAGVDDLILAAVRHSFLQQAERDRLESEFRTGLRSLKQSFAGRAGWGNETSPTSGA
ncbi:MAG: adenosine deaminase [Chloroflexi bacterium]|nr:adenosine deaminase [Chloroflexota bacterium]